MSKEKSRNAKKSEDTKSNGVSATGGAIDPGLASLFAASSGPLAVPTRPVARQTSAVRSEKKRPAQRQEAEDSEEESESEIDSNVDESLASEEPETDTRPRKKRRLSQEDDLEGAYLNRLAREEQKEIAERNKERSKQEAAPVEDDIQDDNSDDSASSASNDLEDLSDDEAQEPRPQHELTTKSTAEYEKTRRTVFLSNVSTQAIKSKASRRLLETHLKSALDSEAKESIESMRFRSTAFDVAAGPKRAAYAKKELMDDTSKNTNVYVVFSAESAARKVAKKLNGTIVLERHLRADWLAHPLAVDHKRCVFVGNLNFVDSESNTDANGGEEKNRRPKAKEPADAEEGLWRAFGKCGTVENVRVVRDAATRVGKGFAYVQFTDEVGAEKALALDGKKFPPMLPRILRVSRAKRVLKKDLRRKRDETMDSKQKRGSNKTPVSNKRKMAGVVFEGYRASSDKGMKFKTKGKKKGGAKPAGRSSRRGAAFKASGGRKKRDTD